MDVPAKEFIARLSCLKKYKGDKNKFKKARLHNGLLFLPGLFIPGQGFQ